MEEQKKELNLVEILKDCPQGMELDCTMYEEATLIHILGGNAYPIKIETPDGQISLNKYGKYSNNKLAKCVIFPKGKTTWEGFVSPCQFKDGDVLVHTQNQRFIMSIYHKEVAKLTIKTHCILWDKGEGLSINGVIWCYADSVRLATEEEKQKLFQAIKDNGYKWNAEIKTLEKLIEPKFKVGDKVKSIFNNNRYIITALTDTHYTLVEVENKFKYMEPIIEDKNLELVPNKFDTNTLVPFDKVLARDDDSGYWGGDFYLYTDKETGSEFIYSCVASNYKMCIPYNEDTKHLLGTNQEAPEYYRL